MIVANDSQPMTLYSHLVITSALSHLVFELLAAVFFVLEDVLSTFVGSVTTLTSVFDCIF